MKKKKKLKKSNRKVTESKKIKILFFRIESLEISSFTEYFYLKSKKKFSVKLKSLQILISKMGIRALADMPQQGEENQSNF